MYRSIRFYHGIRGSLGHMLMHYRKKLQGEAIPQMETLLGIMPDLGNMWSQAWFRFCHRSFSWRRTKARRLGQELCPLGPTQHPVVLTDRTCKMLNCTEVDVLQTALWIWQPWSCLGTWRPKKGNILSSTYLRGIACYWGHPQAIPWEIQSDSLPVVLTGRNRIQEGLTSGY